ncbi:MAG: hypothetical protein A4E35_01680 [Methanoregula sp. PtaU1.Bin051]|nr:MAG: hypothetical protein A4E35_01680 [Methanoregula sp. PtaU1.Bin051]
MARLQKIFYARDAWSDVWGSGMKANSAWDHAYNLQGRLWGGAPFVPGLQKGLLVLELGCGNGKMSAALAEKAQDLIALDFSLHACRLARRNMSEKDNADVIVADAGALPLAADTVGAVVANHVIGHGLYTERAQIVREIVRVLVQGGYLLFCDFSVDDVRAQDGTEVEKNTRLRGNGITTHYFTIEEVRILSDQLRMEDIRTSSRIMRIRGKDHPRSEIMATLIRI